MDWEQRRELQLRRLRDMVARLAVNVPHYARAFAAIDFHPQDLRSLDDLSRLPFVDKYVLRDNYPLQLLAVPESEVVRIHASSGTTGRPIIAGYTAEDIGLWAETIARTLCCGGGTRHDILQVAYGYGLFTGGLGLHYGGERLGCMVIPMSAGNTARQLLMMRDLKTTLLACTPSYALTLADALAEEGMTREDLHLRAGLFGAEVWSESARQAVEERLGLSAHDIYGLTEIIGPGVAGECEVKNGLHIFDDHFYPEIINPATGAPLPPGEKGELVFTSMTKRAFPVLRFRTRDLSALHYEPCACGRTHARMDRITGRTDDMLIIRGVNVFPSQIEEVIGQVEGVAPHYQLVLTREGRLDQLEVRVEIAPEIFSDTVRGLERLQGEVADKLHRVLNVRACVTLVEPKSLERSVGKAKRVIDRREES
jgi:phenylacetate-CoA ligase